MEEIGIEIERQYQWEEQNFLIFSANNGVFQGKIEIYCDKGHLKKNGKILSHFLKKVPDEYLWEIGSKQHSDKMPYFVLRAYTIDNLGHTALQIIMNGNMKDTPIDEECNFSIMVEPWGIHRLGELIINFSDEKYRLLKWSPNTDKDILVEWEHRKLERPKQKKPKLPKTKDKKDSWTIEEKFAFWDRR